MIRATLIIGWWGICLYFIFNDPAFAVNEVGIARYLVAGIISFGITFVSVMLFYILDLMIRGRV